MNDHRLSDLLAGLRWHVAAAAGPGLVERLATGQVTVVKQAPHRSIYRVELPDLDVFVKHYPLCDRRSWLRGLWRPSKARGEHDKAVALAARGIATVEPLAYAEAPGASCLVTRTLPDVSPLNAFLTTALPALPEPRRGRLRRGIAAALGRFLAAMHDAGVMHADLHPGNLLLRLADDDEPLLYLVDLHAVRLGPPLSDARRLANLAVLNRWFVLRSAPSDRLRCWRAYEAARRLGARLGDAGARAVERLTWSSNLHFWRQRDRNCLGATRYFRPVGAGSVRGHAVADLDDAALAPFLADPDAPFRQPGAVLLKDSPESTVALIDLPSPAGPRRLIYKRFAGGGWLRSLAGLVRQAPAVRSFVSGHGLRHRGLPTPRPLAVWQRHRFGLPREGYLLTEALPDAVGLREHVGRLTTRADLHRLIDVVARLVAGLHARRLSHRDLKASNLLVSPAAWSPCAERHEAAAAPVMGGAPQVWFIDLVGVRRHRRLSRRRRVQNVARLAASFLGHPALTDADRARFLRAYLGWEGGDRKAWWREIAAAVAAKVTRNRRNGRPLA
jgi:tRNA A-37 threonylcarbamoyl transferase component Bud32